MKLEIDRKELAMLARYALVLLKYGAGPTTPRRRKGRIVFKPAPAPAPEPEAEPESPKSALEAAKRQNAAELEQRLKLERYTHDRLQTGRSLVEPWRARPEDRATIWEQLTPAQLGSVERYLTTHTGGYAQALIDAGATKDEAVHAIQVGIALRRLEAPSNPRHYYPADHFDPVGVEADEPTTEGETA